MTYYDGAIFTWTEGRKLAGYTKGNTIITYEYDGNGLRSSKTVNGVNTTYTYVDGMLYGEYTGNQSLTYQYDDSGRCIGFIYNNGTTSQTYYYLYNLQGDVTAIFDASGNAVAKYTYDAWGKVVSIMDGSGNDASGNDAHIGNINPIRYKGYYYDAETGLYYVSSRYYDPEIGRFINADDIDYLGADGSPLSCNLFAYCMNNPVNRFDVNGNWSLPNWAKVAIGAAAIAVGVIATAATGGAAAPVLVASLKIAATSAAIGAVSGAGISAVSHRVSTGSWEGAGKAAVTGAIDGACDGFMWGGISAGATFTTVAAKGIKIKEIGKLKPSNKSGDGYSGVKYQVPKANGRYTTRSIELHSPHSGGPHNVWHWQQNTWSEYNGISRITGSAKHWRIWGKRI